MPALVQRRGVGAASLSRLIGQQADWKPAEGITFRCEIRDARTVWNRVDVLLVPLSGHGARWVSLESVREVPPEQAVAVRL